MIELIMLFLFGVDSGIEDINREIYTLEREIENIQAQLDAKDLEIKPLETITRDAWDLWKQLEKEIRQVEKDDLKYQTLMDMLKDAKSEYRENLRTIDLLRDTKEVIQTEYDAVYVKLELAQNTLENLIKVDEGKQEPRYKNISISLSRTCEIMVFSGNPGNCPTYSELVQQYDNTFPNISGKFAAYGEDIRREPSMMQNHWKFYEQIPNWLVIMVDPDLKYEERTISIVIQAHDFESTQIYGAGTSGSYKDHQVTTYVNVKMTHDCKNILVGPDMEKLNTVINYAIDGCSEKFVIDPKITKLPPTPEIDRTETKQFKYEKWLEAALDKYTTWTPFK